MFNLVIVCVLVVGSLDSTDFVEWAKLKLNQTDGGDRKIQFG